MVGSLYVSILLALALAAGHSEAAATGTNAITRRQEGGAVSPFGFGPFGSTGSTGSYSSSTYEHSESHSYDSVFNTYNGLLGSIQSCQSSLQQSGFTYESASQQIQQLASDFQMAFSQFNSCGSCISNQIVNFRQTFSEVFQSFHSLVQAFEQRFPDRWNEFFSRSFVGIQDDFSQFFGNCQRAGLPITTFVPQQLGSFFSQTEMRSAMTSLQSAGYTF